ncbi:hypothetical protein [Saccharothrix hoggarensis]|uniref:Uncharacterized protein n=1 Tax=Saccharothrix hoggarensis TaxID=913853 RepID=A0ABW3QFU8_9PSEU
MPLDTPDLITALRRWTANQDWHVWAAVEYLIRHDHWLRRRSFLDVAVREYPEDGDAAILWREAREAFDAGAFDKSSTNERAVLDFALALGGNRYRTSQMGHFNSAAFARAARDAAYGPPIATPEAVAASRLWRELEDVESMTKVVAAVRATLRFCDELDVAHTKADVDPVASQLRGRIAHALGLLPEA